MPTGSTGATGAFSPGSYNFKHSVAIFDTDPSSGYTKEESDWTSGTMTWINISETDANGNNIEGLVKFY